MLTLNPFLGWVACVFIILSLFLPSIPVLATTTVSDLIPPHQSDSTLPFDVLHGPNGTLASLPSLSTQQTSKITGGIAATSNSFKYFASVSFHGYVSCAASFISRRHLLTAAHCFYPASGVDISTTMIKFNSLSRSVGTEIRLLRFTIHPSYNPLTMDYDVAVLELERDANTGDIQILTLDDGTVNRVGQMATVAGFGETQYGGVPSSALMYIEIPVQASTVCANSSTMLGVRMTNNMMCAGSSGKAICQSDSGAPLIMRGTAVQVGISSFAYQCGNARYPGSVFTKVSALRTWIDQQKNRATPTPLPTLSPGIADTCAAPKPITCGQTVYASINTATSSDPDSITDNIRDHWFTFTGQGRQVAASTCNPATTFDTVVQVYSGSCASLSQVAINDDAAVCASSSLSSNVSWNAASNTQYRIRVRPYAATTTSGYYAFVFTCSGTSASVARTPAPTAVPVPTISPGISDTCAAPKALQCGQTIYASMTTATAADPDSITDAYRDHWYSITGPGKHVWASTCSPYTEFDTFVEVYTGFCSNLYKRAFNDDADVCASTSLSSNVTWEGWSGETYRIRVRAFSTSAPLGRYLLNIHCGTTALPGLTAGISDTCAAPKAIGCGQTLYAIMSTATSADPDILADGFRDQWFSFNGAGTRVSVSTCSSFTNFDTYIEVLTGPCNNLYRLERNDNAGQCAPYTFASNSSFTANSGVQYRIRVRPFVLGAASFTERYALKLNCGTASVAAPTPARLPSRTPSPTPTPTLTAGIADTCAAPKAVTCGTVVYASINTATATDPDSLNDGFRDQWFSMSGNGRSVSASTCSSLTNFNTMVETYTGACSSLRRLAFNDNAASCAASTVASNVTWDAVSGTVYRIRVRPALSTITTGKYALMITCGGAIRAATPTPTRTRSPSPSPTRTRSRSPTPTRTRSRSPTPTRTRSRSPTPTRTRSRSPTPTRTRSPSPSPTLTAGISDTCASPKALACGQTIRASINTATATDPDSLNDGFRDQWYYSYGNGRRFSVSTCDSFTNFNTLVEVHTGSCSRLTRLTYNDNAVGCTAYAQASNVSWVTTSGVQYRIRVRPIFASITSGRYSLRLVC